MRNALSASLDADGSTDHIHLTGRFDLSLEAESSADGTITLERSMVDPDNGTAEWRPVKAYTEDAEETGESVGAYYRFTLASNTTGTWNAYLSDGRFVP